MCGRISIIKGRETERLFGTLGVSDAKLESIQDVSPGGPIQIIHEIDGVRRLSEAIWWLLLDDKTLKPNNKFATFNSKASRLNERQALGSKPWRESRCIIPATAFIEGRGDRKHYYQIAHPDSAIAFGGLFKEYWNWESGGSVYSASIITLPPPLPAWESIHPKSMPLMLPFEDSDIIGKWLSREFRDVTEFDELLQPRIRHRQIVTPIGRPSQWNPIGDSFEIPAEAG